MFKCYENNPVQMFKCYENNPVQMFKYYENNTVMSMIVFLSVHQPQGYTIDVPAKNKRV